MALNTTESTSNSTAVPSDCLVLQYSEFIPWNNPDNIISFQTEDVIRRLKNALFLPILFLIGAPANVINMAVFYKQGLKERINVCLFALSLADELYLICNMVWYGDQVYLQFTTKEIYGTLLQWMNNNYLVGFYGLGWVSQVLSAIIASERCFCVLQPLRSHSILKTSTIIVIIVVVYVVVLGFFFIVVTRYYITCTIDPISKSVIMTMTGGEFYYRHQKFIDVFDVFVFGAGLPGMVVVVVMTTTIVTAIKLRQSAEWRSQRSSRGGGGDGGDGAGGKTGQEIALTKMLVYNSVFFIVCVFPNGVFRLAQLSTPEFNAGRRHHNLFTASLWFINTLSYINATFNIIIYYTMGSRYRQTLCGLLFCTSKIPRGSKTCQRHVGYDAR